MTLTDLFWKAYELDFQEVKIAYLNWAIGYAKELKPQYRHLFLWDHQDEFCIINSRYGRSFAISPFGVGVRGVPRSKTKGIPRGLDEIDIALKVRLTDNTGRIRTAIAKALQTGNLNDARQMVLNFYCSSLVHMSFFLIGPSISGTNREKSGKVVGDLMNPKSGKLSLESETES